MDDGSDDGAGSEEEEEEEAADEDGAEGGGAVPFAPQLRIDADGNIVMDEESLQVTASIPSGPGIETAGDGIEDDGAPVTSCSEP